MSSRPAFQSFELTVDLPPVSSAIIRMGPCMFCRIWNSSTWILSSRLRESADMTSLVVRPEASSV